MRKQYTPYKPYVPYEKKIIRSFYFPLDLLHTIYEDADPNDTKQRIICYCIARRLKGLDQNELKNNAEIHLTEIRREFNLDLESGSTNVKYYLKYDNPNYKLPYAKVSNQSFWNFLNDESSDRQKSIFVLYCAISSMLGSKNDYMKTNWQLIENRIMSIYAKYKDSGVENIEFFKDTFEGIHLPNKRRFRERLIEDVQVAFAISYFSKKGMRGFYISNEYSTETLKHICEKKISREKPIDRYKSNKVNGPA